MSDSSELKRLQDIEAIRQLTAKCNHTFDSRDGAGYVSCWTSDGLVQRKGTTLQAKGHEALAKMARDYPVDGRHVHTDAVITIDGDRATQISSCIYLDMAAPCTVNLFGMYYDTMVRTADGWKFSERIVDALFVRDPLPS